MEQLDWKMLKAVYQAGIRRGNDEASAYDWGSAPAGNEYDNLIEAIQDIVNDGVYWYEKSYISYEVVEVWVKANFTQK